MIDVGVHLPAQNIESKQPIKVIFAATGDQTAKRTSTALSTTI
jgi:hypothetical protein